MTLLDQINNMLDHDYSVVIDGPEYISINEHKSFNPASTIKLYILYAALKAIDQKIIATDKIITIPEDEIVPGAGLIQQLECRQYTIIDILTLMIIYSDNTATNIMLDVLTIDFVQSQVNNLNLKETFVKRKLYHMIPGVYNASSSYDLNTILHVLYEGRNLSKKMAELGKKIMKKQQLKSIGQYLILCQRCHSILPNNTCNCGLYKGEADSIPVEVYSKSGEITGHVHDACIMVINNQPIYISILTSNQKNNKDTKEQLSRIGVIVYNHYKEILC